MKNKILFVTQKREDAIWIVDDCVKNKLKNQHNFVFFELNEKWINNFQIIYNYVYNIVKIIFKSIIYNKIYFSWENPYVIFIKILFPWKKIFMCVHHVEDYWWKSIIWKLIIKSCYKIIAISEFTKNQLIWIWANKKNIIVNYNWINNQFYPEKINNYNDYQYILYVWTELERKNLFNLFESFKLLLIDYPNIKLLKIWLSWDINQEILVNKYIFENNLENNIILIREKMWVEKLRKYYSNCLFYISVSNLEWFWLTVPEAMACWAPVIVSNIWPFKEIVWESQIIVDQKDIYSIENAMKKYLTDIDFKNKISQEAIYISKKFSWEKNIQNLINILTK